MKKGINPVWYLVIGIAILIIPATIYLCFLIPAMKDEYIILMSSGGAIGGAGLFGTGLIPETAKYGTLYKTASKSITLLIVITLVQNFIPQIIGLIAVIIASYLVFMIMRGLYRDGKRARENRALAEEVACSVAKASK